LKLLFYKKRACIKDAKGIQNITRLLKKKNEMKIDETVKKSICINNS